MTSRLAAGAAALVLGAGLSIAALPASAAPAAATHTVTYSSVPPALSSPGVVQVGQTIAFKNSSLVDPITVSSGEGAWTLAKTPVTVAPGQTSAPVVVPAAGTYSYTASEKVLGLVPGLLTASGSFTVTSAHDPSPAPTSSSTPPPSGPLSGLTGGQQGSQGNPPATGGSGTSPATGSGAAATSGAAAGSGGPVTGSGSFDKARFGTGSGDYPSLPGGVIDPVEPQSGAVAGAPAPEVAGVPVAGADGGGYSAPAPHRSEVPLTNASQVVGTGSSSSSVRGPAAAAAALLALVAVGLSRTWLNQRPLGRR